MNSGKIVSIFIAISIVNACKDGSLLLEDEEKNSPNYQPSHKVFNGSYCASLIKWPISEQAYDNRDQDDVAFARYTKLYQKWKENDDEDLNPTNDCLGVARQVFCSYEYPYCDEVTNTTKLGLCQFLCDLLKDRCPDEKDSYDLICKDSRDEECAISNKLLLNIIIMLFIIISFII